MTFPRRCATLPPVHLYLSVQRVGCRMDQATSVLLVDDDAAVREVCHEALAERGYDVVEAATGGAAIAEIRPGRFAVGLVDLRLEDIDGMEVVAALRAADPTSCVIVMTGYADLESAVEAVKHGVYDYVRKPFDSDEMVRIVERGLERRRLAMENVRLMRALQEATRQLMTHKKRLEEKFAVATEELASLIELGKAMADDSDADELLSLILQRACMLTGAAGGHIFQMQPDGSLTARVAYGGYLAGGPHGTADEALRLATEAARLARTVVDNELCTDAAATPLPPGHPASVLVVPIVMRGQVMGALSLYDKASRPFTGNDADLMNVLAVQAAGVLAAPEEDTTPAMNESSDAFVAIEDLFETH